MMKTIKFGTGFAIFIIFFGAALLDTIASGNWTRAAIWLVIGIGFFIADNLRKREST